MANASQATVNISGLFAELNRLGKNQEHERALRTVNKILKEVPDDGKAFHCKVVCLIQLSRFDEALKLIYKTPQLSSELIFEKAYCQYRLNQVQESLTTLRNVTNPSDKIKELLGQVLYRLEKSAECFDVYRDLVKNLTDDYEEERETNLAAVLAALSAQNNPKADQYGLREETYELSYNSACYLLGKKDFAAAEEKLRRAESLCRKGFEGDEDATEEEIDAELEIIRVQLGYVLQMQGKPEQALKLYNQVLKQKPSDVGVAAVAFNNIVVFNKDQNLFDSKKKMRAATSDNLKYKLNSAQQRAIAFNQCLLYMHSNQSEQCRKSSNRLQAEQPASDIPHLILVAQLCKEKQVNKAIQYLQNYVTKSESSSRSLQLTLAQLHLQLGNLGQACELLQSLGEISHKPGVVSALVALYSSLENTEAASEVLMNAVKWYKEHDPTSPDLGVIIRESAQFHLRHGKSDIAVKMLEQVRRDNPSDLKILAQLITAYCQVDPAKADELSREMPSVQTLAADIDVDALESANTAIGGATKYMKKLAAKQEMTPGSPSQQEELLKKRRKKKRRGKLPKNYDTTSDPDPERWLPKRERSNYKGRRKDKRKDIGKGPQGAVGGSQELDASKASPSTSAAASPHPTPSPATAPQGPRQNRPQSQQLKKKKKGKGNKW
ncbi:PREDICTED: signal recognition particle subunit SRP72-like [Priapulus caudatus]|uniref:Signal recognition particle subunit SRP72 n=1 Tax=Priapulus caudatus TaxID=37621 RepID=A0ABM1ET60_PRICU|nr:PREDICTED: signal recognition particle subunit SRP72-like [Priapulus caudatus]